MTTRVVRGGRYKTSIATIRDTHRREETRPIGRGFVALWHRVVEFARKPSHWVLNALNLAQWSPMSIGFSVSARK
jgi:hypothetical protein